MSKEDEGILFIKVQASSKYQPRYIFKVMFPLQTKPIQYSYLTAMETKKMKLLKKYLAKDDRVDIIIAQIIHLFKAKPGHSSLNVLIKKPRKALVAFKSLVLLHNLLHSQAIQASLCSRILIGMAFNVGTDFDKVISQRFLNPYRLFLQRRCQIDIKAPTQTQMQRQVLIFQMMNIIQSVSTFQYVIYTFGRYYEKHKFIIDFNITLAKDICNIYSTIQTKMPPPYSLPFLREIESLHEVMFPIFYNNYFYQFLKSIKIKWIETDLKEQPYIKQLEMEEPEMEWPEIEWKKNVGLQTVSKTNSKQEIMDSTGDGQTHSEDRSFDAISEQFGQEEDEYIVGQFDPEDKEIEKTENRNNLQQLTQSEISNFLCQ